ncbi:hypothetical protein G647_03435 [Cladophialophora carrionii CBS 160.54]|uniref:CENP-C homolog n=1 Tax=Cladophialophora carrionii CBS 160.54 TaxID=1279043 RepID=V9DBK4_9EURO|nr:uncharacterized protein G647_03435 [Cladophialophora carrionii CBS 160.54]ETI24066.1 hypothetical protein G647_03435 [Cladophialophora carrionii CBS 160.54]
MASRLAARRGPANVDYSAVGKAGRRTGVTLDQQPLDAYGMEQISGIFSSPRKPSPLKNVVVLETEREDAPIEALSAQRSARTTPIRRLRSSSPRKSGISGAARKSNGVDIFSAAKSLRHEDIEEHENTPPQASTLIHDAQSPQPASVRTLQRTQPRRFSPSPRKSPLADRMTITPSRLHKPRASLELRRIENEITPSIEDGDFDAYDEATEDVEAAVDAGIDVPPSSEHAAGATPTPHLRQTSEELGAPSVGFDDAETEPDQALEEPAPPASQNKANSRKKRKSDALDQDEPAASPIPNKVAKRRGRPPKTRNATPPAPSPQPLSAEAEGKQPLRDINTNLKLSSRQERELEAIVEKVRARPGPPRSLYILRRETPADDGIMHTRSGRVSVRPLAYWRNERCVYGTSPGGASLADGARFPLNSIKEIVRSEEVAERIDSKKSKGKKKKGKKGKSKARRTSVEEGGDAEQDTNDRSDSEFELGNIPEDPDAEPWETGTGTLRGNVAIWDNVEQAPTEQEEEIEIAHAAAAIPTREVKGSGSQDGPTFRYAKLLSTRFFGTGLVDLPPGGIKRPKNSRKMHMSFFVVKGRVTVTVGPLGGEVTGSMNRFSIGKGGFWQVPRGNQYSIENEMDKPARIFFSQACESAPTEAQD